MITGESVVMAAGSRLALCLSGNYRTDHFLLIYRRRLLSRLLRSVCAGSMGRAMSTVSIST